MMLISVTMVVVLLFVDIQKCRNDGELFGSDKGCDKVRDYNIMKYEMVGFLCLMAGHVVVQCINLHLYVNQCHSNDFYCASHVKASAVKKQHVLFACCYLVKKKFLLGKPATPNSSNAFNQGVTFDNVV